MVKSIIVVAAVTAYLILPAQTATAASCIERCTTQFERCTRPCNNQQAKALGESIGGLVAALNKHPAPGNPALEDSAQAQECSQQCFDQNKDCMDDCNSQDQNSQDQNNPDQ